MIPYLMVCCAVRDNFLERLLGSRQNKKIKPHALIMNTDLINTALKIILAITVVLFAFFYALSTRYDFEVLGKSRDACLRLDKWTGKAELCPISYGLVKGAKPAVPASGQ